MPTFFIADAFWSPLPLPTAKNDGTSLATLVSVLDETRKNECESEAIRKHFEGHFFFLVFP